jgi:hypothetical protein
VDALGDLSQYLFVREAVIHPLYQFKTFMKDFSVVSRIKKNVFKVFFGAS